MKCPKWEENQIFRSYISFKGWTVYVFPAGHPGLISGSSESIATTWHSGWIDLSNALYQIITVLTRGPGGGMYMNYFEFEFSMQWELHSLEHQKKCGEDFWSLIMVYNLYDPTTGVLGNIIRFCLHNGIPLHDVKLVFYHSDKLRRCKCQSIWNMMLLIDLYYLWISKWTTML